MSYDANGNTTTYDAATGNDTFIEYDGQNNVTRLTVGTSAATSTPFARDQFWYGPDGDRFLGRESWDAAGVQRQARTVYLGAFEEVIPAASSTFNLVQRTDLSAGVRHIRTRTTAGVVATRFEYVHRDHLGSVDVVTNASGTMLNNKTSFDPFGGRRAHAWATDITTTNLNTILTNEDERWARGFTEHEMLNRTGFIHMNGRVYDPRIGRFVSPDPIVQAPTFSQSYNRYAYVFNNPLSFTDPSGFTGEKSSNGYKKAQAVKAGESRGAQIVVGALAALAGAPPLIAFIVGKIASMIVGSAGSSGTAVAPSSMTGMASVQFGSVGNLAFDRQGGGFGSKAGRGTSAPAEVVDQSLGTTSVNLSDPINEAGIEGARMIMRAIWESGRKGTAIPEWSVGGNIGHLRPPELGQLNFAPGPSPGDSVHVHVHPPRSPAADVQNRRDFSFFRGGDIDVMRQRPGVSFFLITPDGALIRRDSTTRGGGFRGVIGGRQMILPPGTFLFP